MNTSQKITSLSEPVGFEPIDEWMLVYMGGLTRHQMHDLVLKAFQESGLTQAQLARRFGVDKSQLSKLLNTPANMTLETLGSLLFAIDGSALSAELCKPLRKPVRNYVGPDWATETQQIGQVRFSAEDYDTRDAISTGTLPELVE